MGLNREHLAHAITLEQYREIDAAGQITRPVTDPPIGATTAGRRHADAVASEVVTDHYPIRTFVGCAPHCRCEGCLLRVTAKRERVNERTRRYRAKRKETG